MKLVLVDQEPGLVDCWNREFAAFPEMANAYRKWKVRNDASMAK
jgi:hypothetical protein